MAASSYRIVCSSSYDNDKQYFESFKTLKSTFNKTGKEDIDNRKKAVKYIKEAIKEMGGKFYFLTSADLGCLIDEKSYKSFLSNVKMEARIRNLDDFGKGCTGMKQKEMSEIIKVLDKEGKIKVDTIESTTGFDSHYIMDGIKKGEPDIIRVLDDTKFERLSDKKEVDLSKTGAKLERDPKTHEAKIVYGKSQIKVKSLDELDAKMIENEIDKINKNKGRPQTA